MRRHEPAFQKQPTTFSKCSKLSLFISKKTAGLEYCQLTSLNSSILSNSRMVQSKGKTLDELLKEPNPTFTEINNNQSNRYTTCSLWPHWYSYQGRWRKKDFSAFTHPLSLSKELYEIKLRVFLSRQGEGYWLVSTLKAWIAALVTNKLALFCFCVFFINRELN